MEAKRRRQHEQTQNNHSPRPTRPVWRFCSASLPPGSWAGLFVSTMSKEQKTAKTYAEKLRDPRWQKKRLEVLNRDRFICQRCGDADAPLNVHHLVYDRGCSPWEYDMAVLMTLCEGCHAAAGDRTNRILLARLAALPYHPEVIREIVLSICQSAHATPARLNPKILHPIPCRELACEILMDARDHAYLDLMQFMNCDADGGDE